MRNALIPIAAAVLLAGCGVTRTTDIAADKQGRARDYQLAAGLNVIEWNSVECNEAAKLCGPKDLRVIGGKEQDNIKVVAKNADGVEIFRYEAENVRAFDGQAIRAEVEKELAESGVEATKAVVEGIVSAVRRIWTGGV